MKLTCAAILLAVPALLLAHETGPLQPDDLWRAWPLEPGVLLAVGLAAVLYARGARVSRGITKLQMACFWSGMAAVSIALISPLHPLGEVLFSAHMAQHEMLMLVAAPALVLSRPLAPLVWGLPFDARRAAGRAAKTSAFQQGWRAITRPLAAWWLHAIVLWGWHAPPLFLATLRSEWVHTTQHLSFFFSALLFWWALFHVRDHSAYGNGVFYILTTAIHTGILGALLTFSPIVVYPAYAATAPLWRLTPLEDQQIGGLIMWVPAGVIYMAAGLVLFFAWMRESDHMLPERGYAE
jgi:putative membrane protein